MNRYASLGKRDANDKEVFDALAAAGCDPERFTDFDIAAKHIDGHGLMIEVKVPGQERALKPLQRRLRDIFGDRYIVASSAEAALRALGRIA